MTIQKSEKILEELLRNKNCYNENRVNDYMKKWRYNRGDALLNIGLQKKVFTMEEFRKKLSFEIFKNNFSNNYEDFKKFCDRLSKELKEKFLELSKFYYYWCKEPSIYETSDESFKLVIMTSTIEALMTDYRYKEFKEWFNVDCSAEIKNRIISENKNLELQINELWNEYKKIHGSTRKIKDFFDKFLNDDDKKELISAFKKPNKGSVKLKEIAEWLYSMRSKFVHDARPVPLHEEMCIVGCEVNKQLLIIKIGIGDILSIFERGFIKYFEKRYEENKSKNKIL